MLQDKRKMPNQSGVPQPSPRAGAAPVEWPTLALLAATYLAWLAVPAFAAPLGPWLAIPLLAVVLAQHSSLQHEAIHGHPTGSDRLNEALLFPALGLLVPYRRVRDLHLAHHFDPQLTDPYDDPESNYLDPSVWGRLRRPVRALLAFNNTLLGRMLVGPVVGTLRFWQDDVEAARAGDRSVARAWAAHLAGIVPVALWLVLAGSMPLWQYLAGCYLAASILRIRTFLEHQAEERVASRSVIIEDRGPLALLFLNNNLHAVHHARPRLPWYRLPAEYRARREEWLRRNGGYAYRSYGEVFRRYLLARKDPVAHPIWTPPEPQDPPPPAGVPQPS
jgi:fatty acid desaturase